MSYWAYYKPQPGTDRPGNPAVHAPQGTVGHTPAFWFGATLGLAVQP